MREDLKESYTEQVKRFLNKGKTEDYAKTAAFNSLLPLSRRRLRKAYLERLKWTHRIKRDALHRKVIRTAYHKRYYEQGTDPSLAKTMAYREC